MASRLMAKHFAAEVGEKGSPLQTKVNSFTKGKNITAVHDLAVSQNGAELHAVMLYEMEEEGPEQPRLLSKVVKESLVQRSRPR